MVHAAIDRIGLRENIVRCRGWNWFNACLVISGSPPPVTLARDDVTKAFGVNSIYCSITVNHRLTGPGKMVKLCLLFVGKFQIQKFD